ncbi:MAG: DUF1127 domain-containing protein [Pseudomonadota bacterium]
MTKLTTQQTQSDLKFDFLRFANSWASRSEQRKELSGIPAHLLADIGITEADRKTELNKFFWQA